MEEFIYNRPIPPTKEHIGVDYIYRCGYLMCEKTIHRHWDYCPYCGTKLDWENSKEKRNESRNDNKRNKGTL